MAGKKTRGSARKTASKPARAKTAMKQPTKRKSTNMKTGKASTVRSAAAKRPSAKTSIPGPTTVKSPARKRSAKRRTYFDAPQAPTAKQIDMALSSGTSESLTVFLDKVKL
jgi:hypothetical protein